MANRAKRKEHGSSVAVLEPDLPAEDKPANRIASLLPELPDYLERSIFKLVDDKGFRFKNLTSEQKATFVRVYASTSNFDKACDSIDISPPTAYLHLDRDDDFNRSLTLAKLSMAEKLQETSYTRALHPNGVVDRMCQLKRFHPRIYRESPGMTVIQTNISTQGCR